jgi:hypothetical protein
MNEIRVFLAHAKAASDEEIQSATDRARNALREIANGKTVAVTTGRDDYQRHFARCGSWDAWARDVGQGIDYLSREPRYHAIVVPTPRVGAATANIVRIALAVAKPVLLLTDRRLTKVATVVQVSARDFRTGWEVR